MISVKTWLICAFVELRIKQSVFWPQKLHESSRATVRAAPTNNSSGHNTKPNTKQAIFQLDK